jgi:hypothetical protein
LNFFYYSTFLEEASGLLGESPFFESGKLPFRVFLSGEGIARSGFGKSGLIKSSKVA